MDERLRRAYGLRLEALKPYRLPALAVAIVSSIRGRAKASRTVFDRRDAVRISGVGVNELVRGEDWDKILPSIRDGYLDSCLVGFPAPIVLDPIAEKETALVQTHDRALYERVLSLLQRAFPE